MSVTPADLTLDEKCRLLGGASTWRTHAIERVGVPAVKMSDGPNGVRGEAMGASRAPGVTIPVGIALGATWNPALVEELGTLLGVEAVRKGAHVLLAPTVNLQRTPVGGRVFECYSEDPELTARLCVAFVRGVQSQSVAVTVKHFVANDTEVDRFTVDARVPERALRELYLRPFEAAVREAGAWGVMSAYNKLDGDHCAANHRLLQTILRDEWGFDGIVVSDWFGSHDTAPSALAGLDIAMPGPNTIYGKPLEDAVRNGEVPEARVDELVGDLLRLIDRTDAATRSADREEQSVDDPHERALCRRAVVEGLVLAKNHAEALPLDRSTTVAVLGPNAANTRIMGGGSAGLEPLPHQSILAALTDALDQAPAHHPGVRIDRLAPPVGRRQLRTPDGEPGLLVEYRNGSDLTAPVAVTEVTGSTMLRLFGSTPAGVDGAEYVVTMRGQFVPDADGPHHLSGVITGNGIIRVGDTTVIDDPHRSLPRGPMYFGTGCEEQTAVVACTAGVPVPVEITSSGRNAFCGLRLGIRAVDPPDFLDQAVAAASSAGAAVVVVGTNDEWETEGEDRSTIALPGKQDELIRRVAAVNDRTIVVVNAGSPVSMPWIDDVAAVLLVPFAGQETGPGVAAVLVGDSDPGGRLPITYPKAIEDTPAWEHYAPVDGYQSYDEGLLMGYRGFDAAGTTPLFPFGHGLSYATTEWLAATTSSESLGSGEVLTVEVEVANRSDRPATEVVQVYLSSPDAPVPRAPKELLAWRKLTIEANTTVTATIDIDRSMLRRWDDRAGAWTVDPGRYELVVAASAGDPRFVLEIADR